MKILKILAIVLAAIIVLLLTFAVGYKVGNKRTLSSLSYKEEIVSSKDTIVDTLVITQHSIEYSENIEYITYQDTIVIDSIVYVANIIDTAEIIKEWAAIRNYKFVAFDIDTIGKLEVGWQNQYNISNDFYYSFIPVYKSISIYNDNSTKYKKFRVMGGVSTKADFNLQGMYKMNSWFVVGAQYSTNNSIALNIGIDF